MMLKNENNLPLLEVLKNEKKLIITCDRKKLDFLIKIFDPEWWQDDYEHYDYTTPLDFNEKPVYKNSEVIHYVQLGNYPSEEVGNALDILFDGNINFRFDSVGLKSVAEKLTFLKSTGDKSVNIKSFPPKLGRAEENFTPLLEMEINIVD